MESFGQTKAREGQEPQEPAKKKKRGGNDSVQFLQEKSEKEPEVRKQELKLKEKEQERLFEKQREMMRLMQSLQQSMMALVSKLDTNICGIFKRKRSDSKPQILLRKVLGLGSQSRLLFTLTPPAKVDIWPEDSISQVGSGTRSRASSLRSKSSRSSSSASSTRLKHVEETAKRKALEAKLKVFEEQQALAEKKFQLQQQEELLRIKVIEFQERQIKCMEGLVAQQQQSASKIENPESLRGVIERVPFHLRKRWRATADKITEGEDREIRFDDIVAFVEKESRTSSHPVFGDILRPNDQEREKKGARSSKFKNNNFATRVGSDNHSGGNGNGNWQWQFYCNSNSIGNGNPRNFPTGMSSAPNKTCLLCKQVHRLEDCPEFKRKSYDDRVQFA
ncbi:hypothetical protein AWC38_SpisGene23567 [Stylophora pistillata]|uniref:Uncharacterized protein n=1 Tax=Stylophora pistillata TaxID=50429 RepID=A0A2B4R6N8_STYPI|nr:hypothetical protein AWC38_SpisGene23567 [Stylophora pistillata]